MSEYTQLVNCFLPSLTAGAYDVSVTQQVIHKKEIVQTVNNRFHFAVDAARFALNPEDIYSVYPPAGISGDYQHQLAHVVFNRRTLPWERTMDGKARIDTKNVQPTPWMALIVLDEEEMATLKMQPSELKDIIQPTENHENVSRPKISASNKAGLHLMEWEKIDQKCLSVDLPKAYFERYIPSNEELSYLAHSKRVNILHKDNNGIGDADGNEGFFSVLMGNRILKKNKQYTALVVSLEGQHDYIQTPSELKEKVRMVVLANWNFSTGGHTTFKTLVDTLSVNSWGLPEPSNKNSHLSEALKFGYVPLEHDMRNGAKGISWYRGPFVPTKKSFVSSQFITYSSSDTALFYDETTGLLDVSLASAFELGKILALKNKAFTKGMVAWNNQPFERSTQHKNALFSKKELLKLLKEKGEYQGDEDVESAPVGYKQFPEEVFSFLKELASLKGIPLSYILPDKRMLGKGPNGENTLTVFHLDPMWIFALLNGAVSIGQLNHREVKTQLVHVLQETYGFNSVSGFIIHSPLVSGWRGLEVKTYNQKGELLKNPVRFERITPEMFLGIFKDSIHKIHLKQPYEGLHFGFKSSGDGLQLTIKKETNEEQVNQSVYISQQSNFLKEKCVLNSVKLRDHLKTVTQETQFTSADFGFHLIDSPVESLHHIQYTT